MSKPRRKRTCTQAASSQRRGPWSATVAKIPRGASQLTDASPLLPTEPDSRDPVDHLISPELSEWLRDLVPALFQPRATSTDGQEQTDLLAPAARTRSLIAPSNPSDFPSDREFREIGECPPPTRVSGDAEPMRVQGGEVPLYSLNSATQEKSAGIAAGVLGVPGELPFGLAHTSRSSHEGRLYRWARV
jgi:hypothetical protein